MEMGEYNLDPRLRVGVFVRIAEPEMGAWCTGA
jgi:hypothetical protein